MSRPNSNKMTKHGEMRIYYFCIETHHAPNFQMCEGVRWCVCCMWCAFWCVSLCVEVCMVTCGHLLVSRDPLCLLPRRPRTVFGCAFSHRAKNGRGSYLYRHLSSCHSLVLYPGSLLFRCCGFCLLIAGSNGRV